MNYNYNNMSDKQKKDFILEKYQEQKLSFKDIADSSGTYANKIRRDAVKFKIKIRDKSEAQRNAITSGKTKHPTKGTKRSEKTKEKIGNKVLRSWENLSSEDLNKRKLKAKQNWENKTEEEKRFILREANNAVREASKKGSKLEIYLLNELLKNGFSVDFHKEQSILNTKLQIDLFLPKNNIAIEVDGPSHFEPVWGSDALAKNKKYDNKKTGLILGKGLYLIRIKQSKDFSKARAKLIFDELIIIIDNIENKKETSKTITIGA
jgi:very-short-patch-repair endonuclease